MPINRRFTAHGDYAKALRQTHVAHKKEDAPYGNILNYSVCFGNVDARLSWVEAFTPPFPPVCYAMPCLCCSRKRSMMAMPLSVQMPRTTTSVLLMKR